MVKTRLLSFLGLFVLLMLVAGCAEILPPGWNSTANQSPTSAVAVNDTVLTEPETSEEQPAETVAAPAVPADANTPRKTLIEGELVSFPNLKATDPDGDPITYTFTPPLDAAGKWQTKVGDAGEYRVTVTASDGKNSVSQVVIVQVNPKNRAPTIALAEKEIHIKEGDTVTIQPKVTDPDGDKATVTYEGWMTAQSRSTAFEDAGRHEVTITASDGKATSKEIVAVYVENIDRAPTLQPINDIIIKEGDKITVNPTASDPDGEKVTFVYSSPVGQDGTWQTEKKDVGKYRVNVTATDGALSTTTSFLVLVQSLNQPPVIQIPDLVTVDEGQTVTLTPSITDPEGDELTITYTGWMNTNTFTTTYESHGTHVVTITASDGINTAKKDVTLVINDVNRPPEFGSGAFV